MLIHGVRMQCMFRYWLHKTLKHLIINWWATKSKTINYLLRHPSAGTTSLLCNGAMYVWVCGWVARKIYVSPPSTNSCNKFNYTFLLGKFVTQHYGKAEPITTLLHVINFIETFKGNIIPEFQSWWDSDDINDDGKHWMHTVRQNCIPYRLSSSNSADGICDRYPDDVEFRTLHYIRQKNGGTFTLGTSLVEGKNVVNFLNCR